MEKVCVLGLGYIGLPTASILATNGFKVLGVDVNEEIVHVINRGGLPIEEPGLKTIVQAAIHSGNFRAALQPEPADVFIIAVPTPVTDDKKADLSFIKAAAESIVPVLNKGNLVILESTSPPGTTKNFLVPILEKSGLKIGEELFVAYCPERVLPGKILTELINNNRIIGGINDRSAQEAKKLYSRFVEGEIVQTDSTTSEMVKLVENTYRDVNIALVNELAIICDELKINVWDVIKFANLHPRVNLHLPGPGVGGHCLAVDPWFIVDKFPREAKIISLCRKVNDSMPHYVLKKVLRLIENIKNPKITILGVSYKANIDDVRESPALTIIRELDARGVNFSIYDPHVKQFSYEISNLTDSFKDSNLVLVVTDHEEFKYLYPLELGKIMRHRILFDTRNCLNHNLWKESGFDVYVLGTGDIYKSSVICCDSCYLG